MGDKSGWDEVKRVTMILKWTEIFDQRRLDCWKCGNKIGRAVEFRKHLRRYDGCLKFVEGLMIEHTAGWDWDN